MIKDDVLKKIQSGTLEEIYTVYNTACSYGDLDVVKYILTSNDVPFKLDPRGEDAECDGFLHAIDNNHLNIIEFLTTSELLEQHIDIDVFDNHLFISACGDNYLDIVKFSLTSPKLTKHADIHAREDAGFFQALKNLSDEVLKYLIFDRDIQKTEYIKFYINDDNRKDIDMMFKKKKFHTNIKNSLENVILRRQDNNSLKKKI